MKRYIHYGSDNFDKTRVHPIENQSRFSKPYGGFWASPVNSNAGWKNFCECENFRTDQLYTSFKFVVSDSAKVLHLKHPKDLESLPIILNDEKVSLFDNCYIDFEYLIKMGYDAVEVEIQHLYWPLYGWDCDSILIMNPDIVEVIENDTRAIL